LHAVSMNHFCPLGPINKMKSGVCSEKIVLSFDGLWVDANLLLNVSYHSFI
jgi:hypothetical protein